MVWFIGRRYLRYIHPVILRRSVSTLSPLTQSFNAKPSKKFNLNLRKGQSGLFLIPELSSHEGFYLLQQQVENEIDDLVKETTSTNRKRKIVQIFDQMSDSICRVADM
ncbi:mitochondrial intermediate peptidase [Mytilus galloprovincialis]|uniref:Mitochondrial intermediate peptidase n=1 Tax=Mytilus galloprovincialis TaxID=29158 RepID=A0A8B6H7L1_MYTGA|nr:mitochondrial intermediate peptidase [Mytilus galloprovincialis]